MLQHAQQPAVAPTQAAAPKSAVRQAGARHVGNQAQLRRLATKPIPEPLGQSDSSFNFANIPTFPPDHGDRQQQGLPLTVAPFAGVIQRKLEIGAVNDPLEAEADRVAEQVMRMPGPAGATTSDAHQVARRKCTECQEEDKEHKKLTRKESGGASALDGTAAPPIVHEVLRSAGHPLDATTRAFFEPRFGHDFGNVRVHTGEQAAGSARAIGAKAYTCGKHIVLSQPYSDRGLMAHELSHVVQAAPFQSVVIRRQAEDKMTPGPTGPASGSGSGPGNPAPSSVPESTESPGTLASPPARAAGKVKQMTFDCGQKIVAIDAETVTLTYKLQHCSMPVGSYMGENAPAVLHQGKHKAGSYERNVGFGLKFPVGKEGEILFNFNFSTNPGKPNPADLLESQDTVDVQVVEPFALTLGGTGTGVQPKKPKRAPECRIRFKDHLLIAPDSGSIDLFKPMTIKQTVWTQPVPLGEFGFVDVDANVKGSLTGKLSGRYGPGMLTDICLSDDFEIGDLEPDHPLLRAGGGDSMVIGGHARFHFPASAKIVIEGKAGLVIAADYLEVIRVGAIEGGVGATGEASANGTFDAKVDVLARLNTSSGKLEKIDLAAHVSLQGHAGLSFSLDAYTKADFLGFTLWSEKWNLRKAAKLGFGWGGGVKYSPNPGVHWILGAVDRLEEIDRELFDDDQAHVNDEDLFSELLDTSRGAQITPDGLSKQTALPFTWHKPIDMYPGTVEIPNAEEPKELNRDDGPTSVRMTVTRGRGSSTVWERIGVQRDNWVGIGDYLHYVPHADEPRDEQDRLRGLLTTLGYDRSGTQVDHVRDIQFGGQDHFRNLWPLDQATNSAAGPRHQQQLANYQQVLAAQPRGGTLEGRIFVISDVAL